MIFLLLLTAVLGCYESLLSASPLKSICRCFPGDSCYPDANAWDALNATVGGKLIATIPIAAIFHFNQFMAYDEQTCATLRDNWFYPETHLPVPSSATAWMFTNNTCNPFLPSTTPYTLGNYVSYAINATTTNNMKAAVNFANSNKSV